MAANSSGMSTQSDFVLSRRTDIDNYGLWRVDLDSNALLQAVPLDHGCKFDRTHQLMSLGGYLLEWGPLTLESYQPSFPYRLLPFDPKSGHPLAARPAQHGLWPKWKFLHSRVDFGNPTGAHKGFETGHELLLVPLGCFVLNLIPTAGRTTFQLWNFDPCPHKPSDPLPRKYTPQGAFGAMESGCELIPLGNYVLHRMPATGEYWLWSFDPQNETPLAEPAIQRGRWRHIDERHQLVAIGHLVLDWVPADRSFWLWQFDPKYDDPLTGPVCRGVLPDDFDAQTTLTGIQALRPVDQARKEVPGTIDFMRSKIKHVIHLMLENRSFDHTLGWLYEKGDQSINFVGHDGPFDGASLDMFNMAPEPGGGRKVSLNKYRDGKLSDEWNLDFLDQDPYHDKSDILRQCFMNDHDGYAKRAKPDMGGFVWNNGTDVVMSTYTPEQLPVLAGLAKNFAVSDAWFSSMPSATDPNRAFAFTGSALCTLNNFQNGDQYTYWNYTPHRPSVWKVLWSNGFDDWKIYNSVEWEQFRHTYHLFLEGQIPSVDANFSSHIATIDQFKKDAQTGNLPAFSTLEPVWIAKIGTTSYHPGGDLAFGEQGLNEIYETIKSGPGWEKTLFVITFDEHGGLFDHVPPPYAEKPWPNDVNDGFYYDMMGVRVPTILVSPWIKERTVFRSPTEVAFDSTSFLATLLHWFGIPKARWSLGDRTHHAPTFEAVFQCTSPRSDRPSFTPPYDKNFPRKGGAPSSVRMTDLHALMAPRVISSLAGSQMSPQQIGDLSDEVLTRATDLKSLHVALEDVAKKLR